MRNLYRGIDENIAIVHRNLTTLRQAGRRDAKTDCREGCSHCCHGEVTATAPEVIALASAIRETFPPAATAALIERLTDQNGERRGQTDEERAASRRACPMLEGDRCSFYANRPLTCRTHHSSSVDACRDRRDGISTAVPIFADFSIATKPVFAGAMDGFRDSGCAVEPLWFSSAREIALQAETAERWCRGENPFAAASNAEHEARLRRKYEAKGFRRARP